MTQLASIATDWITSVSTLAAAIGTVGSLILLSKRSLADRSRRTVEEWRRADEERRRQAEEVTVWLTDSPNGQTIAHCFVRNDSGLPVFNAIITPVIARGSGPRNGRDVGDSSAAHRTYYASLPPNETISFPFPDGWGGMHRVPGAELAFTDASNRHWVRSESGALSEIPDEPTQHYAIALPVGWKLPPPA